MASTLHYLLVCCILSAFLSLYLASFAAGAPLEVVYTNDDEPNNRSCYPIPRPGEDYTPSKWPEQTTYVCAETMEKMGETLQLSDMPSDGSVTIDGKTWAFLLEHTGVPQRVDGSIAEKHAALVILYKMETYFRTEVLARPEYMIAREQCTNNNELCAFWASVGECEQNRGFMLHNCAAACRLCLLVHTNFGVS